MRPPYPIRSRNNMKIKYLFREGKELKIVVSDYDVYFNVEMLHEIGEEVKKIIKKYENNDRSTN